MTLFTDAEAIDVEAASNGRFGPALQSVYDVWDEFVDWVRTGAAADAGDPAAFRPEDLGPPAPEPAQIFAIGLNYTDHAKESNLAVPDTFTKYRTALTGPVTTVRIPTGGNVDWEVETGRSHRPPRRESLRR